MISDYINGIVADCKKRNTTILIELLITRKCNYRCKHCMYDCSPDDSSEYMSDETLGKIKKQIDFLNKMGLPTCINLIGGEPTINFSKFEHIFREVETWNTFITIGTNAWWLDKPVLVDRFFKLISKRVQEKRIIIRLSDDDYHIQERKIKYLDDKLQEIFSAGILDKYNLNYPSSEHDWIYDQSVYNKNHFPGYPYVVYPNGRGKSCDNYLEFKKLNNLKISDNMCLRSYPCGFQIHYDPWGKIYDACGQGSIYDFGTVDDNILFIASIIWKYKAWRHFDSGKQYDCYNCRTLVQEWKKDYLEDARELFSKFNTMNYDTFMKELL